VATLTIRNLPDDVRDRLRVFAAENGRSMEAEARLALVRFVEDSQSEPSEADMAERIAKVQRAFREYVPEGKSLVEEFLAERRRMWGEE
jgi:plasmid stability protein